MQKPRKCTHILFMKLAQRKLLKSVWIHGKLLHFWTQKSWKYTQKYFCKPRMRLNITAKSFVFGHKSLKCTQKIFFEPCKRRTSKMRLNSTANRFDFGRINRENAPKTFFINLAKPQFPKCVWINSKQLHFWTQKSRKCAHNFIIKLAWRKLPKSVWTSWINGFVCGCEIVIMRPENLLYISQSENFQNASELSK